MGWPDWRGECVAIVASGPSAKGAGVEKLRNRIHVIAIKENVNLCPWADVVYGCDAAWWNHRRGLPEFAGLKLTWGGDAAHRAPDYPGLEKIRIEVKVDRLLFGEVGLVGAGGNSGFQALNLATQFGATAILLLGFDLQGGHWYGRNNWANANNPDASNFPRWRRAFEAAAPDLKKSGIDVVNASPSSTLNCFPKMSVDDALRRWGL